MSMRLSQTTSGAAAVNTGAAPQLTPLYDRQYMTLHSLLEREMRNRVESEKMIRDDMTQVQEGMARICNQIQEVASDLKANLPRLFQETKELRRETQQLTLVYQSNVNEMNRLTDAIAVRNNAVDTRFDKLEQLVNNNNDRDVKQKQQIWEKLCSKAVVQELADKVGCLDLEAHAKFTERKEEHDAGMLVVSDLEQKVQSSLDEFVRGLNKCDFLYQQCSNASTEFKKSAEKVTEDHRDMIDQIVFPRIERCENLLNQEMCERVECLKKIAHELVHSKEQTDKIKDQLERLGIDLANSIAAGASYAAQKDEVMGNGGVSIPTNGSPLMANRELVSGGVDRIINQNNNSNTTMVNNNTVTGNVSGNQGGPTVLSLAPQIQSQEQTAGQQNNNNNINIPGPGSMTMPSMTNPLGSLTGSINLQKLTPRLNDQVMIGGRTYPAGTRVLSSSVIQRQ